MSHTAVAMSGQYPCLDEYRHYRSFPCSLCAAPRCWMGAKPQSAAWSPLTPGQKHCEVCGSAYRAYGKSKYCGDVCRKKAISKQRRRRRSRVSDLIY